MSVLTLEKEKQLQKPKTDYRKREYALLSIVGGFLQAYAIINRDGLFANAQTSNFTNLWVSLYSGKIGDFLYHILPILLYCAAVFSATLLPLFMKKFNWSKTCIIIELLGVLVLGLLPSGIEYKYAILPIFFITALQFQTFQSCNGYVSSTIFCTNNMRQCISAFAMYLVKKDKKLLKRSGFYLFNISFFAVGVVAVFIFSSLFGDRSIWFCMLPLIALEFLV